MIAAGRLLADRVLSYAVAGMVGYVAITCYDEHKANAEKLRFERMVEFSDSERLKCVDTSQFDKTDLRDLFLSTKSTVKCPKRLRWNGDFNARVALESIPGEEYGWRIERFNRAGFMIDRKCLWSDGTTRSYQTIDGLQLFDRNGNEIDCNAPRRGPSGWINI